ncbi:MAG TPA: hypothetical protein VIV11_27660 [Kofleriaceae bacterium]
MRPLVTTLSIALTGCAQAPVLIDAKLAHVAAGGLLVLYALMIARPRRSL